MPPRTRSRERIEEDDTVEFIAAFDVVLHSVWLLPVLVVLIAIDAPFPIFPSETVLMSAAAAAFGTGDIPGVVGLFLAALIGSALGDLTNFGLGRTSNKLLPAHAECGLSRWVRANLFHRPGMVMVGARFLPGGRLVSTAAAGRVDLPLRRFLPSTLASSAVWSVYMLLVGMLLGPIVGGNPLMSLAAGAVIAVLTTAVFAIGKRVRARFVRRPELVAAPLALPAAEAPAPLAAAA